MSLGFLAAMFTVQAMGAGFCVAMYLERRDARFVYATLLWMALAVITLGIPLIAAIPCRGQPDKWPTPSKLRWAMVKAEARDAFILSEEYTRTCMQDRNEWMVNRCDRVAALWDGSTGGTANCVNYAEKVGRPVDNLWSDWVLGTAWT